MVTIIDNQQDCNLNSNQIQVLLTGTFGDGHISLNKSGSSIYSSNCIHEEYIDYKLNLLENLAGSKKTYLNQGFKKSEITSCISKASKEITNFNSKTIEQKLNCMNEVGLALWFYDDGSLHKKYDFFNLNTHKFSEEIQQDVFIPFFDSFDMKPKILKDKKQDGREFSYLYFGKHFGTYEIMQILEKYPIDCFKYKLWSSETIQKWSKLKAELKSRNMEVSPRKFTNILNGVSSI